MFFWFMNDTFSIIDALLKLILVITGSALIICFCHKLTNYKKTRRFKSDVRFIQSHVPSNPIERVLDNPHHRQQLTLLNGTTTTGQYAGPSQQHLATFATNAINSRHLLAYDPYNIQLRQFACSPLTGDQLADPNNNTNAGAYGFQTAAIDSLSGLNPAVANELIRNSSQILISSSNNNNNNNDINLISNPVYSSSASPFQIPLDCSTIQAHQSRGSNNNQQSPDQTNDLCPSYEEAIASGGCLNNSVTNQNPNKTDDGAQSQITRQSSETEDSVSSSGNNNVE